MLNAYKYQSFKSLSKAKHYSYLLFLLHFIYLLLLFFFFFFFFWGGGGLVMPSNLKKLKGHIALDLSVSPFMRPLQKLSYSF